MRPEGAFTRPPWCWLMCDLRLPLSCLLWVNPSSSLLWPWTSPVGRKGETGRKVLSWPMFSWAHWALWDLFLFKTTCFSSGFSAVSSQTPLLPAHTAESLTPVVWGKVSYLTFIFRHAPFSLNGFFKGLVFGSDMKTNEPLIPFPWGEAQQRSKNSLPDFPSRFVYSTWVGSKDPQSQFLSPLLPISLVTLYLTLICGLRALNFPGGTSSKEPACQWRRQERQQSIPGSGASPGGGHGNPLQYSCPENPMHRGAWQATVHGSQRVWHDWACMHTCIHVSIKIHV